MSTEADATLPPAPKKSKKLVTLVAVIVAGVVLGGGAGVYLAGPLLAGGTPAAGDSTAAAGGAHGDGAADAEHGEGGAHGEAEGGVVHLVENLVLNPAHSGGSRFLLVSIGFAVADEATAKTLEERDPELRDVIIRCFGAKTVDELTDVTRRDSLKVELREAVGERFGASTVREIYFPQFVIQ
ncbi:MAG TPA: flagellar basal body-associated FliL family protein [Gemmatimonadaceae bacterium]|nr:flagellar basal body-associated FliL family protein [Gemmatimonadaceae bacterium]